MRLFSSSPLVVTPEPFNESVGLHRRWALRAMHEALLVHAPQDSLRDGGGRGRMAGEAALQGKIKRRIAAGGKVGVPLAAAAEAPVAAAALALGKAVESAATAA